MFNLVTQQRKDHQPTFEDLVIAKGPTPIIILRYNIIFGAIWKLLNPFLHNLTSTLLFQTQIPSLFVLSTPCSILVSTQPHLYFSLFLCQTHSLSFFVHLSPSFIF